jgi:diacylglycerol kinase (ATP)
MKTVIYDMKKIVRSIVFAIHGLRHAYRGDKSFRMEVNYGLPVYLGLAWFLAPFEPWELLLYTFSYILILLVELVNTAFETILDHLHPGEHHVVGKSKDIASAAVFVAFIFALIVLSVLAYSRCQVESGFSVGGVMV